MEAGRSDPLAAADETPDWPGTLVAEWRDRGLAEQEEWSMRHAPLGIVALALYFGLLLMASVSPAATVLLCGPLALVTLGPILWLKLRHRTAEEMTLMLDQDVLRVVRRKRFGTETTELARSEAGLLVRRPSNRSSKISRQLLLADAAGSRTLQLLERDVQVRSTPSGMNFDSYRMDVGRAPLDVLIGSWWPHPGLRVTRRNKARWSFRTVSDRPWGRPDLGGYALWQARGQLKEGVFFAGAVVPLLVIGFILGLGQAISWWPLALFVVPCLGLIFYGACLIWRARMAVRRLIDDLTSLRLGAILKRNG
ncbi:MAG TPA: hypothetical protein VF337_08670 [Candidatus Limnocylindrales bacterium]